MKSRTSFFNVTALKKNVLRFAPVWALYTVFLLLVLFAISGQKPVYMARDVLQVTLLAGCGNICYAAIVALCLFGDLYKTRLCCALHAFPMRREGWLLTNIATGILFSVVPNILVCALTSLQMGEYSFYIWNLFHVAFLQYLFFFGTAVLSALCTGNKLGMIAVYSIIHFIIVLLYYLADAIYEPLLYGIELRTANFYKFVPVMRMVSEYVNTTYDMSVLRFLGYNAEAWEHLWICAGVGIVCFVLAWLIYRRRHLERAGDFVSFRPVSPVFLVIYTVTVGALFYSFSGLFGTPTYVLYATGIIIGYFTGRMLLERTVRVFYKKSFVGFAALALAVIVSMVLTWADPLGIGRYVPALDRVKSVAIYESNKTSIYHETYRYNRFEITDPEEIAEVQDFHRQIANLRPSSYNQFDVRIRYTLDNGTVINRYYQLDQEGPLAEKSIRWFSDPRYVFQVNDTAILYDMFAAFHVNCYTDNLKENYLYSMESDQIKGLLDALVADCEAGKMAQIWWLRDDDYSVKGTFTVSFELKNKTIEESYDYYRFRSLTIYSDCTNTVAYLEKLFANQDQNLGY